MCEKNGIFVRATSCVGNDFCVGPSSEEWALNGTRKLCSSGNVKE